MAPRPILIGLPAGMVIVPHSSAWAVKAVETMKRVISKKIHARFAMMDLLSRYKNGLFNAFQKKLRKV
jgi:hypothetical protein